MGSTTCLWFPCIYFRLSFDRWTYPNFGSWSRRKGKWKPCRHPIFQYPLSLSYTSPFSAIILWHVFQYRCITINGNVALPNGYSCFVFTIFFSLIVTTSFGYMSCQANGKLKGDEGGHLRANWYEPRVQAVAFCLGKPRINCWE